MFIAVSKHTTAGAKRIVPDTGIDLRPRRKRESVAEISRRWQEEQKRAIERRARERAELERQLAEFEAKLRQAEAERAAILAQQYPPAKVVMEHIARQAGFTSRDLRGPSRNRKLCEVRFDAIAEVYERCRFAGKRYTVLELGRLFNRDHSSITHSLQKRGLR